MSGINWKEIAKYGSRALADLSASVTHWTKARGGRTAFDVLRCIIRERRIIASTTEGGFIKANQRAACFSETPVTVMMRVYRLAEHDHRAKLFVKWEPYALSFWKPDIYQFFGGRPVLYLSEEEYDRLVRRNNLESSDAWRVVRLDHQVLEEAIDFTHEREWRTPGDVDFAHLTEGSRPLAVVNNLSDRDELMREFPPGNECPVRGVLCLADLRAMG